METKKDHNAYHDEKQNVTNDSEYTYGTKNGTVSVICLLILVFFVYLFIQFH